MPESQLRIPCSAAHPDPSSPIHFLASISILPDSCNLKMPLLSSSLWGEPAISLETTITTKSASTNTISTS